ncbi:uncharacterized protein LOC129784983 [Falco peregrinus]|uniref:uncharacterized protein LOC129784983 n=1 Tax=Falco peregrinus TaxID=8954 RepID=UPI0024785765|nr:uncharacterized protein LOC129784983 [Falco peregrinus]
MPRAAPRAARKGGMWGVYQNRNNTGQSYSGLCINCPEIKGRHFGAFELLHSSAVPWHQPARLRRRRQPLCRGARARWSPKGPAGTSRDPPAAGRSPGGRAAGMAPERPPSTCPAAEERGRPGGAPPAQGAAAATTGQRRGPSPSPRCRKLWRKRGCARRELIASLGVSGFFLFVCLFSARKVKKNPTHLQIYPKKRRKLNPNEPHLAIPRRSNERVWETTLVRQGLFWVRGPGSVPKGQRERPAAGGRGRGTPCLPLTARKTAPALLTPSPPRTPTGPGCRMGGLERVFWGAPPGSCLPLLLFG